MPLPWQAEERGAGLGQQALLKVKAEIEGRLTIGGILGQPYLQPASHSEG